MGLARISRQLTAAAGDKPAIFPLRGAQETPFRIPVSIGKMPVATSDRDLDAPPEWDGRA